MILDYNRELIKKLSMSIVDKYQEELDRTLGLSFFLNENAVNSIEDNKAFQGRNTLYKNPYPRTIRIAPSIHEMYLAIKKIQDQLTAIDLSDMSPDDKYKTKRDMCRDAVKPKQIITIKERPPIWWGDTLKGINCRPGFVNNDRSKSYPFILGGKKANMLICGNVGEGKSVLEHAIITNWLWEYPPWELKIIMNDIKMLEFARYVGTWKPPHIVNVGVTGSAEYLASVTKFFNQEMMELYNLSKNFNVAKLAGIREYLDLMIPSYIHLCDEISSATTECPPKIRKVIDENTKSVAKRGRAMQMIQIFTSQTFTSAIESDTMTQFPVGAAVGSGPEASEQVLGNDKAVELTRKIGYCLVNDNRIDGKPDNNIEYKVAFLDVDSEKGSKEFLDILSVPCKLAKDLGINDEPTWFNESDQNSYDMVLKHLDILEERYRATPHLKMKRKMSIVPIILGPGMQYEGGDINLVHFLWANELSSNIFIHSTDLEDIKYLTHLVGDILDTGAKDKIADNIIVMDDNNLWDEDNPYVEDYSIDLSGELKTSVYLTIVKRRNALVRYNLICESKKVQPTIKGFISFCVEKKLLEMPRKFESGVKNFDYSELDPELCMDIYNGLDANELDDNFNLKPSYLTMQNNQLELVTYLRLTQTYDNEMKKRKGDYLHFDDFKANIFWLLSPKLNEGIFRKDILNNEFLELLRVGPQVGMFFIIITMDTKELNPLIKTCKHCLITKPSLELQNSGLVVFNNSNSICCLYFQPGGEEAYFKKYLKLD